MQHSFAFLLIQMHQRAGTITSSVNLIDTSLLAEALTQTAILSPAGIASNQVLTQEW